MNEGAIKESINQFQFLFFCFFLALWSHGNERSGVPYVPLRNGEKIAIF